MKKLKRVSLFLVLSFSKNKSNCLILIIKNYIRVIIDIVIIISITVNLSQGFTIYAKGLLVGGH